MKKVVITGISGQDGIFLTNTIIKNQKDYMIFGISRNKNNDEFYNKLKSLNTNDFSRIKIDNVDLFNKDNVLDYLEHIVQIISITLLDQALFINLFKS